MSVYSTGAPPHTFRLTDEDVDLDGFEPGWYWALLNGDEEHVVRVTVFEETHGIWVENERAGTVDFCPMDKLDPELWSGWAGPLPSPGWDSMFPLLNCGEVDRFPPTHRAATMGCTGTGESFMEVTPLVPPGVRVLLYPHNLEVLEIHGANGPRCTADDAVRGRMPGRPHPRGR